MTTPSVWYTVSRRFSDPGLPPAVRHHLGLGADHWPEVPVTPEVRCAVETATDWFSVPTLTSNEWLPLMTDAAVARAFYAQAVKHDDRIALLSYSLHDLADGCGWDIGPPQGGHSAIPHELSRSPFASQTKRWLNRHQLFATRAAAEEFWRLRCEVAETELAWETPSAWAIVQVAWTEPRQ